MRYFRLYHSDPFYQTSDVSLKSLAREIFKNWAGCSDGYEKVWERIDISWGDEELGGSVEVENHPLSIAKVKIKGWDEKEKRVFETREEFWSWYELYRRLSSVVGDFIPTFRYNPMYTHDVQVIADFYSFPVFFDLKRDFDEEVEKFYKFLIAPAPWSAVIYSCDNEYPHIEIYLDCHEYQFKEEHGKFKFYLPTIENPSQLKEFMKLILAETYDRDVKEV